MANGFPLSKVKGGNWVLRHFQQLRSYRDKIETLNREKIPIFTKSSKGSFSCRMTNAAHLYSKVWLYIVQALINLPPKMANGFLLLSVLLVKHCMVSLTLVPGETPFEWHTSSCSSFCQVALSESLWSKSTDVASNLLPGRHNSFCFLKNFWFYSISCQLWPLCIHTK